MSELTKSRKRNKPQRGQTKLQMEQTKLQTNDITKNHVKKKRKEQERVHAYSVRMRA